MTPDPSLMQRLGAYLKGEEDSLPAGLRKKVYRVVKVVASLATLALLLLPALPGLGIEFTDADLVATIATAVLALTAHLADPNTPAP